MKRANRLLKNDEYRAVLSKGTRIGSPLFTLLYVYGDKLKLGIMVSKKTAKRAVDRNKAKRRVRAIVAKVLPVDFPCSIVIIVKPPLIAARFADIQKELTDKIKQIGRRGSRPAIPKEA